MKILKLDKSIWGNKRLFDWQDKTKSQCQNLANQVVDYFHIRVKEENLILQWKPGNAEIILNDEEEIPDMKLLGKILKESYQQVELIEISQSDLI